MPQSGAFVSFSLLLSISLLSFAQDVRSTSPAVQELKRWIAAYDNSDWDIYSEFLKTNFAPQADNMFRDRSVRGQTGALISLRLRRKTPMK